MQSNKAGIGKGSIRHATMILQVMKEDEKCAVSLVIDRINNLRQSNGRGYRNKPSIREISNIVAKSNLFLKINGNRGVEWRLTTEGCEAKNGLNVMKPTPKPKKSYLTPDAVREIRLLHKEGLSIRTLSKQFSVTKTCISRITKRQRWASVD